MAIESQLARNLRGCNLQVRTQRVESNCLTRGWRLVTPKGGYVAASVALEFPQRRNRFSFSSCFWRVILAFGSVGDSMGHCTASKSAFPGRAEGCSALIWSRAYRLWNVPCFARKA